MVDIRKIKLPIYESIFYFLFLIFTFISLFYSIDKEVALGQALIYLFAFVVFIFSFNLKESIKKKIPIAFIVFSLIFAFIYYANYLLKLKLFTDSNSLFYAGYTHLQLGNFFLLGLIASSSIFLSSIFFILILFSYSRTAYITLLLFLPLILPNKKYKPVLVLSILITLFFLLATSKNYLFTKEKTLLGNRDVYFSYALSSIKEKPWFGIGPGNFYFAASKRQVNFYQNTTTAHNILLDILAENGVLAGVSFLAFLVLVLIRAKKTKNYYLLLALTLVFMVDFSYQYLFFLLSYFILLGASTNESKKTTNGGVTIFLLLIVLFIFSQLFFLEKYLSRSGYPEKSLRINPYQKYVYRQIIEKKIRERNYKEAKKYLITYNQYFGRSFNTLLNQTNYWEALGSTEKSLELRTQILYLRPLDLNNIEKIYEYGGNRHFLLLMKDFFQKNNIGKDTDLGRFIKIICKENKLNCQISFL